MNRRNPSPALLWVIWIGAVLWAAAASAASAQVDGGGLGTGAPAAGSDTVRVSAAWSVDRARPGDNVLLAVVLDIQKGFHINADPDQVRSSGEFKPVPTRVEAAETPGGLTVGPARFPAAHAVKMAYAEDRLMFFDGQVVVILPVGVDRETAPGGYDLRVEVSYQACDDRTCLFPKSLTLNERLTVIPAGGTVNAANDMLFSHFEVTAAGTADTTVGFDLFGWHFDLNASSALGLTLLFAMAAFGGLLLNFTPCVLPLVPIKIISLSNAARDNRGRSVLLGAAMFLGVLAFWLFLGALIATVSGFTATNQLFQYPPFTIAIGVFIAVMGLGMCGLFHTRLPGFLYLIDPDQESLTGSFALGILAAILSTPCTAPFMGAAAAWATTRPAAVTLSTFAAIGVGMASPYLILSVFPNLAPKLPKTGPGSVLLKQVMGLLMLAAAAYFVGGGLSAMFSRPPDPPSRLYWWAVAAACSAAGAWLSWRVFRITRKAAARAVFAALGLVMVVGSVAAGSRLTAGGPVDWVGYTPGRFADALADGKVVVLVFTAEWCLNCKALEQGVLYTDAVAGLLNDGRVVPMRVDITGNNPDGKRKLREVGSLTIPLLAVFSPDGRMVFKQDFYTAEQIAGAVAQAGVRAGP